MIVSDRRQEPLQRSCARKSKLVTLSFSRSSARKSLIVNPLALSLSLSLASPLGTRGKERSSSFSSREQTPVRPFVRAREQPVLLRERVSTPRIGVDRYKGINKDSYCARAQTARSSGVSIESWKCKTFAWILIH